MADKHWISPSYNPFDSTNWSSSSGGPADASSPTALDIAIFDLNSPSSCYLDKTTAISGLVTASGYTGTLSQNGYPLIIGSDGASLSTGTFDGTNADITVQGPFDLNGCDFTSTNAVLSLYGQSSFDFLNFHSHGGTVSFRGNARIIGNDTRFSTLEIDTTSYIYHDGTCVVDDMLMLKSGMIKQGENAVFEVRGDVSCTPSFGAIDPNHSSLIVMNGNAGQQIHTQGGIFPKLEVDKITPLQVTLHGAGPLNLNGGLDITDGTLNTYGMSLDVGLSSVIYDGTTAFTTPPYWCPIGMNYNYSAMRSTTDPLANEIYSHPYRGSYYNLSINDRGMRYIGIDQGPGIFSNHSAMTWPDVDFGQNYRLRFRMKGISSDNSGYMMFMGFSTNFTDYTGGIKYGVEAVFSDSSSYKVTINAYGPSLFASRELPTDTDMVIEFRKWDATNAALYIDEELIGDTTAYNPSAHVGLIPKKPTLYALARDYQFILSDLLMVNSTQSQSCLGPTISYTVDYDGNGNTGGTAPASSRKPTTLVVGAVTIP